MTKTGWYNKNKLGYSVKHESHRHSLAAKGIKTALPKGVKNVSFSGSPTPNFDMVAKGKTSYLKKPLIREVKKGMVFKVTSKQFGRTNYARVTERPYFEKHGDRPNIFYAIFVNPKNFKQKRMATDREFAIWDFNYTGKLADKWRLVQKNKKTDMVSTPHGWVNMRWKDGRGKAWTSLVPKTELEDIKTNVFLTGGKILKMNMLRKPSVKQFDLAKKQEYHMKLSTNALRTFFKKHTGRDVLKGMKFVVVTKFKDNPNKIGNYNPNTNTITIRKDQLTDLRNATSVLAHEVIHKIGKNYDETRAFENDLTYALGHAILD